MTLRFCVAVIVTSLGFAVLGGDIAWAQSEQDAKTGAEGWIGQPSVSVWRTPTQTSERLILLPESAARSYKSTVRSPWLPRSSTDADFVVNNPLRPAEPPALLPIPSSVVAGLVLVVGLIVGRWSRADRKGSWPRS